MFVKQGDICKLLQKEYETIDHIYNELFHSIWWCFTFQVLVIIYSDRWLKQSIFMMLWLNSHKCCFSWQYYAMYDVWDKSKTYKVPFILLSFQMYANLLKVSHINQKYISRGVTMA